MNEKEALGAYEQLSHTLRQQKLGWVVDQVDRYLRLGKSEEKEIPIAGEEPVGPGLPGMPVYSTRRGRKPKFLATVDYTAQQRLQILAIAITHAVPHLSEIATKLRESLRSVRAIDQPVQIVLVHETEDGETKEWAIEPVVAGENMDRFRDLLHRLAVETEK